MTDEVTQPSVTGLDLTDQEKKIVLESLNLLVKSADNALQASTQVLPIAAKISQSLTEPKK